MKVIVDTSVWSLAFRKKTLSQEELEIVNELKELVYELRILIIGPIRQELLSGIADKQKYENLKEKFRAFEDLKIYQEDYENAAEIYNECRKNGVRGSHIDFLISSVAINNEICIFTTDRDFENYSKIIDLKLHKIREEI